MRKNKTPLIIASVTLAVILFAVSCIMCIPSSPFTWDDALGLIGAKRSIPKSDTVYFLPVGQGDCTVIISGGKVALIDCGTANSCSEIKKFLSDIGCRKIECIFITHPHSDHIGGAAGLSDCVKIAKVVTPDWIPTEQADIVCSVVRELKNDGVTLVDPSANTVYKMGNAIFDIIQYDSDAEEENNRCAVIKLTVGESSFLFTGDIDADAEQKLVNNSKITECTVLKAGHHGSKNSTSEELLSVTDPEYVIFSCGLYNTYGHPDDETVRRVKEHGATCFRTDIDGTVTVDAKSMKISTEY